MLAPWHRLCPLDVRRLLEVRVFANVLLLAASLARAAQPDSQLILDVSAAVHQYGHYTIFDDVTPSVREGIVTLTGKVTQPHKRADLHARVARVDGVRDVRNQIDVLPVSGADDELRQRIARSIYGNGSFREFATMPNPPIHIVVEHGRVTLTGVVRTEVDRTLARALAAEAGALSITNNLQTITEVRRVHDASC
jgi:hyperosmotically inducible periplasmic protein